MNKTRHTILAADQTRKRVLIQHAKTHKVSTDDLVQAGIAIHQGDQMRTASKAAKRAARELPAETFAGLSAWPYVCQFCGQDFVLTGSRIAHKCGLCGKQGCTQCIVAAQCPECRKEPPKP